MLTKDLKEYLFCGSDTLTDGIYLRTWISLEAVILLDACNYILTKNLYDSIKKTRIQTKDHNDSLIAQVNSKTVENADLKAQIQEKCAPGPQIGLTGTSVQDSLQNLVSSQPPYVHTIKKDMRSCFQPMFDVYFNLHLSVSLDPGLVAVAALRAG
ncbi:hypothetical protein Tco_0786071 [Tanacetum coccineum]